MNYFAHNGVDHATELESATHSGTSTLLTVVLITLGVIAFIITATLVVRKFAREEQVSEEDEA